MKKLLILSSLILIITASQAFACNSPKFCQTTPNSTNGWTTSSYVCGCNDPVVISPGTGERPNSPNGSADNSSRGGVISK